MEKNFTKNSPISNSLDTVCVLLGHTFAIGLAVAVRGFITYTAHAPEHVESLAQSYF